MAVTPGSALARENPKRVSSLPAEPSGGEQGERASVEGMGCTLDEELLNSPVQSVQYLAAHKRFQAKNADSLLPFS